MSVKLLVTVLMSWKKKNDACKFDPDSPNNATSLQNDLPIDEVRKDWYLIFWRILAQTASSRIWTRLVVISTPSAHLYIIEKYISLYEISFKKLLRLKLYLPRECFSICWGISETIFLSRTSTNVFILCIFCFVICFLFLPPSLSLSLSLYIYIYIYILSFI